MITKCISLVEFDTVKKTLTDVFRVGNSFRFVIHTLENCAAIFVPIQIFKHVSSRPAAKFEHLNFMRRTVLFPLPQPRLKVSLSVSDSTWSSLCVEILIPFRQLWVWRNPMLI